MANRIGERIKSIRAKAKITQTELASKVGVTQSMIVAYEKGYRMPSVPVLAGIADTLGCTVDEIIKAQGGIGGGSGANTDRA